MVQPSRGSPALKGCVHDIYSQTLEGCVHGGHTLKGCVHDGPTLKGCVYDGQTLKGCVLHTLEDLKFISWADHILKTHHSTAHHFFTRTQTFDHTRLNMQSVNYRKTACIRRVNTHTYNMYI